jgi:hypothetical protein
MAKTTKTPKKSATKPAASDVPVRNSAPAQAQAKPAPAPTTASQAALNKPTTYATVPQSKPLAPLPSTTLRPAASVAAPPSSIAAPVSQVPKLAQAKPITPLGNHIYLELVRPDAKAVFVAGSFNEWKPDKTPLSPAGNGRWVGDLSIKPGRHEYLFVVDGQWLPDPNAIESVGNPFGGKNSVLVVSE